jgi:hypothetical protein
MIKILVASPDPKTSRQIDKGSAKISDTESISALFLLLLPDSAGNRSMQLRLGMDRLIRTETEAETEILSGAVGDQD